MKIKVTIDHHEDKYVGGSTYSDEITLENSCRNNNYIYLSFGDCRVVVNPNELIEAIKRVKK